MASPSPASRAISPWESLLPSDDDDGHPEAPSTPLAASGTAGSVAPGPAAAAESSVGSAPEGLRGRASLLPDVGVEAEDEAPCGSVVATSGGDVLPSEGALALTADDLVLCQLFPSSEELPGFRDALLASLRAPADRDPEILSISEELCGSSHIRSLAVKAEQAGVSRKKFSSARQRLPALAVAIDRWLRAQLVEGLAAALPQCDLVFFVDCRSYDETPMRVAIKDSLSSILGHEGEVCEYRGGAIPASMQASDVAVAKVFQTRTSFACIVRIGVRLVTMRGGTATWLQVLDRTTAEIMHRALCATRCDSPSVEQFATKLALVSTDSYSANMRLESFTREGSAGWGMLHLGCHLHKIATCHSKTFGLVEGVISGAIRYSLSLRVGSAMRGFRAALRQILLERLVILRGQPTAAATSFREAVLSVFLTRGAHLRLRLKVISTVLNGDWRNREQVEVYLQAGDDRDEAQIRQSLAREVTWALAGRVPATYPRHRWTGADEALSDLGLVQSVHGLASASYTRWIGEKVSQVAGGPSSAAQETAVPIADGSEHDAEPAEPERGDGPAPARDTGEAATPTMLTWAEQNDLSRRLTMQFICSGAVDLMPILSIVVGPLATLLRDQMVLGGDQWEARERRKQLEALAGGTASVHSRRYRIVVAAEGELEDKLAERVEAAQSDSLLWQAVHPQARTGATNELGFRMLHMARAVVHHHLTEQHLAFPYKLFRTLVRPDLAEEIAATRPCLLDRFSSWFLAAHQEGGLHSEVARAQLLLIAELAKLDTADVEVSNGRIRRHLLASSHSTHTQDIVSASSDWVTNEFKRRDEAARRLRGQARFGVPSAPSRPKGDRKEKTVARKRKSSFGGGLRAYIRLHHHEERSFAVLARRYRELGPIEREKVQRLGREMTALGQAAPSVGRMGPRRRAARAVAKRKREVALDSRLAAIKDDEGIDDLQLSRSERVSQPESSLRSAIQAARQESHVESQVKGLQSRELAAALDGFVKERTPDALNDLGEILKFAKVADPGAFAVPAQQQSLEFAFPSLKEATKLLATSWAHPRRFQHFLEAIDNDWERKHASIGPPTSPAFQGLTPAMGGACWKAGVCICSPEGRDLQAVRRMWWAKMYTGRFKFGTEARALLAQGSLVCRLDGESLHEEGIDPQGSSDFYHLAFALLSPLRATFVKLQCIEEDLGTGRVLLKTTTTTLGEHSMFATLNRELQWEGAWFQIEASSRPMLHLQPDRVWAIPLKGGEPTRFWPPPPRQRMPASWLTRPSGEAPSTSADQGDAAQPDPADDHDDDIMGSLGSKSDDGSVWDRLEELVADAFPMAGASKEAEVPTPGGEGAAPMLVEEFGDMLYTPTSPATDSEPEIPEVGELDLGDEEQIAMPAEHEPAAGRRRPADSQLAVGPHGMIHYYKITNRFVAHCTLASHGSQCFKTRTSLASERGGHFQAQGRPLGHLAAWLLEQERFPTKAAHFASKPSQASRAAGRLVLETIPNSAELLAGERPVREGEANEPDALP